MPAAAPPQVHNAKLHTFGKIWDVLELLHAPLEQASSTDLGNRKRGFHPLAPDNPTNDYGKLKDQIGVEIPDGSSTGSRSKTDALNSLEARR